MVILTQIPVSVFHVHVAEGSPNCPEPHITTLGNTNTQAAIPSINNPLHTLLVSSLASPSLASPGARIHLSLEPQVSSSVDYLAVVWQEGAK